MKKWIRLAGILAIAGLTAAARAADKSEPLGEPAAEPATLRCLGAHDAEAFGE
jgi:hypothetical protein